MTQHKGPIRIWRNADLSAVSLGTGMLQKHFAINRQFLMERPLDGLLYPFRDAAGMQPEPASEQCFGVGYGEFCGGWLMAAAAICRMTGDSELHARLDQVLDGLADCAHTTANGYLPTSGVTYYPYYTYGVMLNALRVAAEFTGRQDIKSIRDATATYVVDSLKAMGNEHARRVIRGEYPWWDEGNGLCEALALLGRADALDIVGGQFLHDPLARNEDVLQYRHANATLMLIMGWPAAYELTGQQAYLKAFFNAWPMILARTYVTGGSCDEFGDGDWEAWPAANDVRYLYSTQETCTAYHWMRHNDIMLCYSGNGRYGDMIERVLYNKMLTSHQANGAFRYWTDMRDYARLDDFSGRFTCCSNSGVRAMAQFPSYIYYLDDAGPIVNLFVSSTLRFDCQQTPVKLKQATDYPADGRIEWTVACDGPCAFDLRVRIPGWVGRDTQWTLNGEPLSVAARPGTFASLHRTWHDGDRLSVILPLTLRVEKERNNTGQCSVLCGPIVLAGVGRRPFLRLTADPDAPEQWLRPSAAGPLHFDTISQWHNFMFKPFYEVRDDELYNLHFAFGRSYPLGSGHRATGEGLSFAWPELH